MGVYRNQYSGTFCQLWTYNKNCVHWIHAYLCTHNNSISVATWLKLFIFKAMYQWLKIKFCHVYWWPTMVFNACKGLLPLYITFSSWKRATGHFYYCFKNAVYDTVCKEVTHQMIYWPYLMPAVSSSFILFNNVAWLI